MVLYILVFLKFIDVILYLITNLSSLHTPHTLFHATVGFLPSSKYRSKEGDLKTQKNIKTNVTKRFMEIPKNAFKSFSNGSAAEKSVLPQRSLL